MHLFHEVGQLPKRRVRPGVHGQLAVRLLPAPRELLQPVVPPSPREHAQQQRTHLPPRCATSELPDHVFQKER